MAEKGLKVRRSHALLRSSEAILEADQNGSLSLIVDQILTSLDELYKKKKYDSFIKHSLSLLEIVNGKQIKLETELTTSRPVNIVFRRANPDDAR